MTPPAPHLTYPAKPRPSAWAVALLVASSGFAAISVAFLSSGFTIAL